MCDAFQFTAGRVCAQPTGSAIAKIGRHTGLVSEPQRATARGLKLLDHPHGRPEKTAIFYVQKSESLKVPGVDMMLVGLQGHGAAYEATCREQSDFVPVRP